MAEKPEVKVGVKANQFQAMMRADGMVGLGGKLSTLSFRSPDGRISLLVPPEMFPFIEKEDTVFVSVTVVKHEAEVIDPTAGSPILRPN